MGKWLHRIIEIDGLQVNCSNCSWVPAKLVLIKGTLKYKCSIANSSQKSSPNRHNSKGKHGLTKSESDNAKQDNHCQICGSTKTLVVDHCHNTGRVRGVLCQRHNIAIGLFKDSIPDMVAAIEYLERNI